MRPRGSAEIPAETVRVVRAACRKGTRVTHLRDAVGPVFADDRFAGWFAGQGRGALAPGMLALVCVLQSMEQLSDRQAAVAVAARMDWKYALSLPLEDPGFDHTVLAGFRDRLEVDERAVQVLEAMLAAADAAGLLRAGGRVRTDSSHVIAHIRHLCRWELIGETVRLALEEVADLAPGWLAVRIRVGWEQRYGRRIEASRLPRGADAQWAWAGQVAGDGGYLLDEIAADPQAAWLLNLPQTAALAAIWTQQCVRDADGWRLRKECLLAGSDRILSPHDPDARWSAKRSTTWEGYKVHLSETCDDDLPHLVVGVQTTPATDQDVTMLAAIHDDLISRGHAPGEHYVDTGYVTPEAIHTAAAEQITVIGPVMLDSSWQAKAGKGFDRSKFVVDWDTRSAICPAGKLAMLWRDQTHDCGTGAGIRFDPVDCAACPSRGDCTRDMLGRQITLPPRPLHEIQMTNRANQHDTDWQRTYHRRAGIEATISEAVRAHGLRHTRHRGLARTRVSHVLTACGMNAARIADWHARGDVPARRRPRSRLVNLCGQTTTAS